MFIKHDLEGRQLLGFSYTKKVDTKSKSYLNAKPQQSSNFDAYY